MTEQSLKKIISARLWSELTLRNRYTPIPQVILCFISAFVCYEMHTQKFWTLIPYVLVVLALLARTYFFFRLPKNESPTPHIQMIFYSSAFILGVGWSLLFIFIHDHYGLYSPHSGYCLMLIAGLWAGGIATFAAAPKGYLSFLFPMTVIPVVHLFITEGNNPFFKTTLIVFFSLFYIYQIRLSHFYLRKSIENEAANTLERDKLRSLINTVPGFVSFIDNDLIYRAINEFAESYYQEKSIIGKSVGFLHPESEFVKFVQNFMQSTKETSTSEIKIEFQGEPKSFVVSIKKILDPMGGAVIVSVPMDELVEARKNLRVQEAKSHYTAKLVSLGEMAAGIAHEINNPLAIIQGSSDQMEKMINRSDTEITKLLDYNSKIQKTVGRISRIIKSLKGLARNGENDPFLPFEFQNILEPCIEISRQRFRDEKVELKILPYDTTLKIVGQEIQLSQVLMNLINNAFDAAVAGGNPRWVNIELSAFNDNLEIRVQDSGLGVPKEIRNKIMEPFFTTKPINKGTGLGLSISKNIMEQHQGTLILDESSAHTTFVMRIKR